MKVICKKAALSKALSTIAAVTKASSNDGKSVTQAQFHASSRGVHVTHLQGWEKVQKVVADSEVVEAGAIIVELESFKAIEKVSGDTVHLEVEEDELFFKVGRSSGTLPVIACTVPDDEH